MKKRVKTNHKYNQLIISMSILLLYLLFIFIFPKFTGYIIQEQKKRVQFYFYDEKTNCSLNGYVFSGDKLIGKTNQGYFNLTYENYLNNFQQNENISLFGKLNDCFTNNQLYFDKYWKSFEIKDYYFSGESKFEFKTKINPNNPSKRELIGFIQNKKLISELNNININKDNLNIEDLSKINNYLNKKINYTKDWDFNKKDNYWQTPEQTLSLEQGDCEDYSTALLSLFLAYNNSLNCYNIIFTSHVTTFCQINNYYIYYDQEKTELKKQIRYNIIEDKKTALEKLEKEYFEYYRINETERAYYAFNNNQYIEFNNNKEFIDWQASLNNKQEFDLFEKLGQESIIIQEKYPQSNEDNAKLATENPLTQLASEKPTIQGFFKDNFILIISLLIVFIMLIIILIKINKKRIS